MVICGHGVGVLEVGGGVLLAAEAAAVQVSVGGRQADCAEVAVHG